MHLHLVEQSDLLEGACPECGHAHTADDRCHSAYDADYCPLCGTASSIGRQG